MWKSCKVVIRALTSCSSFLIGFWLILDLRVRDFVWPLRPGISLYPDRRMCQIIVIRVGTGWWPIPRSTLFSTPDLPVWKNPHQQVPHFRAGDHCHYRWSVDFPPKPKLKGKICFFVTGNRLCHSVKRATILPSNSIQMSATWFEH